MYVGHCIQYLVTLTTMGSGIKFNLGENQYYKKSLKIPKG